MNYTHLSQSERYQIQCLRDVGLSITQTALRLGRHRSTIAREIRRNSGASTASPSPQRPSTGSCAPKRSDQRSAL